MTSPKMQFLLAKTDRPYYQRSGHSSEAFYSMAYVALFTPDYDHILPAGRRPHVDGGK